MNLNIKIEITRLNKFDFYSKNNNNINFVLKTITSVLKFTNITKHALSTHIIFESSKLLYC